MADILPYLGIAQTFSEKDLAGKTVVLEDFTGMTVKEAEKWLKAQGLTARTVGAGETVTAQLPEAGQTVPGGSQMLLYLDGTPEDQPVSVPDFTGMNRQQANDTALSAGVYLLVRGNQEISPQVVVTAQSLPAGSSVPRGSTITLEFTDTQAVD